jgi:hypothetical protein
VRFLFRILGILILAALVSAAWLFRADLMRIAGPKAETEESAGMGVARPSPKALAKARDRVDSLHGWHADSVILSATELASLITAGLPAEARSHVDSLGLTLGENSIELHGRLDTKVIPKDQLGPFASMLNPWEPVAASGPVSVPKPGFADWTVEQITIKGIALPQAISQNIAQRVFATPDSRIRIPLPKGIGGLRIHPDRAILYPAKKP